MNSTPKCPDLSLLSRFMDQELDAAEEKQIRQHVQACPICQTRKAHLSRIEEHMHRELQRSTTPMPLPLTTPQCLSPEVIANYLQGLLTEAEEARAETHLHSCDQCMREVMHASQLVSALTASAKIPVPVALTQQVAASWTQQPVKKTRASLSRLVLHLAQKGVELVEHHLTAPLFNLHQLLTPTPAYRTSDAPTPLDLKMQTEEATLHVTITREGDGAALILTLQGERQEALSGQRVFLRRDGRSIYSAKTDLEGTLRSPHLTPGVYEVTCSGVHASFQLELHE